MNRSAGSVVAPRCGRKAEARRVRPFALGALVLVAVFVQAGRAPTVRGQSNAVQLYNQALQHRGEGEYRAAIDALKRVVELDPSFDRAYGKLVAIHRQLGEPESAREYLQALAGTEPPNQYAHYGLALFHRQKGELDAADKHLITCLAAAPDFAPAYGERVEIARSRGRLQELSGELRDVVGVDPTHAAAHYGLGHLYQLQGDPEQALSHLDQALRLRPESWEAHRAKFLVYYNSDKFTDALEILRTMLGRAESSGDLEWEARIRGLMGSIYKDLSDYDLALEHSNHALRIARRIGFREAEQAYLANVGVVYSNTGRYAEALEVYGQALSIARALGDRLSEGRMIGLIGNVHLEAADYSQAIDDYSQAAAIAAELGDRASEATQLATLSSIHVELGDYHRALEKLQTALRIVREIKNLGLEAAFLQIRGSLYEKQGQAQNALADYSTALTTAEGIGDKIQQAAALDHIGGVQSAAGDYVGALASLERALKISREIKSLPVEGKVLNHLGKVQLGLKNYARAREAHQKALDIAAQTLMPELAWQAHAGMAAALTAQGELAAARGHYREAVEAIDGTRGKLEMSEDKAGFFQGKVEVYKSLIDLLIRSSEGEPSKGYEQEAFYYAERARARAFLDMMAEGRVSAEHDVAPTLLARRQQIQARISQLQSQLLEQHAEAHPDSSKIKPLEEKLIAADEEYQDWRRAVRRRHPRYADLRYPDPIRLEGAQRLLDAETVLLEYSFGEEASYLFALSRDGYLVARLPEAALIYTRVKRLREAIARPNRVAFSNYLVEARWLFKELILPAERLLAGRRNLIIAPDGLAHYLPFEVLLKPDDAGTMPEHPQRLPYLVRDYAISYVPSASVLAGLDQYRDHTPRPRKAFVAFADPVYGERREMEPDGAGLALRSALGGGARLKLDRLKQSGAEVQRIAGLFPPSEVAVFLGGQASESNVKAHDRLAQFRIVHFAVHGLLNEQRPQFSALVLSLPRADGAAGGRQGGRPARGGQTPEAPSPTELKEDGLLQVYEIFNLRMSADMVILSACETGLGKEVKGEGLVGMTRAFLYAGSQSVVASLWKTSDLATEELMVRFYRHLRGDSPGRAEALRRARLELIGGGQFSHPYFWSPFILVGKS